ALPLTAFARALAQLADPSHLAEAGAAAARRIVRAMTTHPELVAGSGRADTILMRAAQGRAATKAGAEGFFAAIVPEAALGIAVKIDDGAGRAAETVIAALLDKLGLLPNVTPARALVRAPVLNTRNEAVGERQPSATLNEIEIEALRAQ